MLSVLFQFEQTQWWSSEKVLVRQLDQIKELIRYSILNIPLYKDRLDALELNLEEKLTIDEFHKIPTLSRQELVESGSKALNLEPPKSHGKVARGRTTGSSGRPLEYYGTQLTQLFWQAFTLREHLWHQRSLDKKLAVIRFGVENTSHKSWGPPVSLLYESGPSATLDIKTDIEEQIEWLIAENPSYLLSFPSNIRGLAEAIKAKKININNLKEIRTVGEAFQPDLRDIVGSVFNAKLVDTYSASETGYIAIQCPDYDHYHIQSEGMLVEVLGEDNRPCQPGETGRVVVTDLHNFAMPLIRYDLQDYATVGEPCPCGRGLPVLTRINGRARNLVQLPDGRSYWPLIGFHKWMDIAPIEQIQIKQKSLENITVTLVMPRKLTTDEQRSFESILADSLGHKFDVLYDYVAKIEPGPGGKYEEFLSEL